MTEKSITILDTEYKTWISELSSRYRKSQIKAALKVNDEMLRFYYGLGKDIVSMKAESKWGSGFMKNLSRDLKAQNPEATCFSPTNLLYMKNFYLLYQSYLEDSSITPQSGEQLPDKSFSQQLVEQFEKDIFSIPWGHHKLLIDKFKNQSQKALFFVRQTLLNNITNFLLELGTGFAYVGKEYCLHIGEKEKFIDLLFYNLTLSCYVVIEVKIGEFDFADAGQLGGYVVACNHILRKEGRDNPTIGLLICKQKDNLIAQYSLESSSQPLGISEYELEKLYPEKVEGTIPTIEEIEKGLSENIYTEN
jgi:hypothetical protein